MDILDDISKTIIEASTTLSSDKCNALKKAIDAEDNENANNSTHKYRKGCNDLHM